VIQPYVLAVAGLLLSGCVFLAWRWFRRATPIAPG
jgi:hypothetical protein